MRLKKEINRLLIKEEKMWKQHFRALWSHEGDSNTRYFHKRATHSYCRNKIFCLENSKGEKCTNEASISNILVGFYQALFTSANLRQFEQVLEATSKSIMEEMNLYLTVEFRRAEVEEALRKMKLLKALGPDGMPPLFFQWFWPIIGDDALQSCFTTSIQVLSLIS